MAAAGSGVLLAVSLVLLVPVSAQATGVVPDYEAIASGSTGASQTATVPAGVCGASFIVAGGAGGGNFNGGAGYVAATLTGLVAGQVFTLEAGGSGTSSGSGGTGGYASGGNGDVTDTTNVPGGGGGAASAVLLAGVPILVAGGSGGAGSNYNAIGGSGGSSGVHGVGNNPNTGFGAGGVAAATGTHQGGNSTGGNSNGGNGNGGGGGGGYQGGAAGAQGGGGGGGSNYLDSGTPFTNIYNGSGGVAGYVSVTWAACAAPTAPTVTAGSVTASSLSFTFPAATPSSTVLPVTGYFYQLNNSGTWTSFTPTGSGTLTGTISNLSPGTNYSLKVAFGYVPPNINASPNPSNATSYAAATTATSVSTSVAAVPGAPSSVVVTPGSHQLAVSWVAPTSSGSSPITSYTATASNGASCTTTTTSCVIPGLTPGTFYTVTVTATNSVGTSAPSTVTASVSPLTSSAAAPSSPPSGASALQLSLGVSTASNAHPGDAVLVQGTGFAPNSLVDVFVYSTPTFLGTGTVNASGAFSFSVNLPSGLAVGAHTVVASGFDPQGVAKFASAGINVASTAVASTAVGSSTLGSSTLGATALGATALGATGVDASHSSALAAGIGLLGLLLLVLARRRTARVALRTSSAKEHA